MSVIVSGATGRTGRIVYNLLKESRTPVKGLVRSEEKGRQVLGSDAELIVCDITDREGLHSKFKSSGAQSLVLLSSAVPELVESGPPPVFSFPPSGMPEIIDYNGAVNQIDAAISAGVSHIVMVGSMGSTDINNMLNKLGNGNILVWKRKAEEYLIEKCDSENLKYTVINPAGLVDKESGEKEIVFGKGDDLFDEFENYECSIARADVARVVIAALEDPNAKNKAFDVGSHTREGFTRTLEFSALFNAATPKL